MAFIYLFGGIAISLRDQWDVYLGIAAVFGWAIIGYTLNQEKPKGWKQEPGSWKFRATVIGSSALHAAAHIAAVILFARYFAEWNEIHPLLPGHWYTGWIWLGGLLVQMGIVGFFVGSTLFGLNLLITCRWLRMNRNDAFSALRLGRYNNFLRVRIKDDTVEIFVVGLDDVPDREDLIANPNAPPMESGKRDPDQPIFLPKSPLNPRLIEKIAIR
jgi:hypothetical protein